MSEIGGGFETSVGEEQAELIINMSAMQVFLVQDRAKFKGLLHHILM